MLKRAAADDIDAIVAFESQVMNITLYGKPLDHAAAQSEIGTNEYYLRLDKGNVVATGALRRREDRSAYLSNIAVHPATRRQGIARVMIRHLLSLCDAAPYVDLAVHPDNHAARSLYVSLGFLPMQICENFFGDGEPRLIMQIARDTKSRGSDGVRIL
ncbi:MAG: GNAT family N-acetyltransferase [Hyphomicrobiaceae bacterium]|nr:GNAT family N-acetyltransferase [Hyphomicrobiaceae bacterium]